ncbi:MAG: pyridoxal-phosphate dependent enzyme [Alphaproteobacteria bacterium]|nr:pyridoxal-phosphate dependent enzyme [Alphaproteobacteria bacterium]
MQSNNVWRGSSAIREFLKPESHITPLVELNDELNPFLDKGVHIFIKMQTFLPLKNVKSIPAYQMLKDTPPDKKGLVESSSGNMAFSLSVLSKYFGYDKMRAIISHETNLAKLEMLLLSGAEVFVNQEPICPDPRSQNSGIALAKKMAKGSYWQNLNQYANEANPKGHYQNCANQLIEQMDGDIQIFCSSLGTTGSMNGIGASLKKINTHTVGVVRKPNNPVPGPRTLRQLQMIEFDWQKITDEVVAEGTENAYIQSLKLCRQGILAGPSSGLNLAGLLTYLRKKLKDGSLGKLRNEKNEINCVTLACDLPFLYLDEYFKYVPRNYFARIHHQERLLNQFTFPKRTKEKRTLSCSKVLKEVFSQKSAQLWKQLAEGEAVVPNPEYVLLDIRRNEIYNTGHIPTAINIEEGDLPTQTDALVERFQDKTLIVICEYGELSYLWANIFAEKGVKSFSLEGGITKWSDVNYPRISNACPIRRGK